MINEYSISETDIKIRFNKLCRQFENSPKYDSAILGKQSIPEDEDISYEMIVNSKRYEAVFYQHLEERTKYPEKIEDYLLSVFSQEQLDNPNEEEKLQISNMKLEFTKVAMQDIFTSDARSVWFMISNERAGYKILMFYDNNLNRSNGEDL